MPIIVALTVLAAPAAQKTDVSTLKPQEIAVDARPFALDPQDQNRRDFGRLEWRGGLILTSATPFFGGYSGLSINADGGEMLAVSDAGSWLSAHLVKEDGGLTGLTEERIGPITQKNGRPLQRKKDRDAEALTALKQGGLDGRYLIGFEHNHRIEEYRFRKGEFKGPIRRLKRPSELKSMRLNEGFEGITYLRGGPYSGSLIAFAEKKLSKKGDHTGVMIRRGKSYPLFLAREAEFNITDLEGLKDGSLLVLERSFIRSSLKLDIRLRLIPAKEIKPGSRLRGEVLFEAGHNLVIDNFEGLAATETEDGETLITLISDDNFNFFQKTILAQFALKTD